MTLEEAKEVLRPLIAMMTDQWGCPISDVPIALEVLLNKVDAEPVRHGHWDIYYNDNIPYTLKCSECGEYTIVNGKYCPNCGCKMDLDEVNE